jgi:hypothetical protein
MTAELQAEQIDTGTSPPPSHHHPTAEVRVGDVCRDPRRHQRLAYRDAGLRGVVHDADTAADDAARHP